MDKEAIARIVHGAMRWAADNSCTDKHPEWQGGNSFAEDEARKAATDILATLSPAEPSPESREGWQPIETLTKGDGYVLGWSGRSDDCGEREYFMGRLYDIRPGALLNEWTGRWRGATHWRPLPSPPASAIRALSAPAHD
jgi:hypothetical protein